MKVSKIPGLGRFGVFIDDLDFNNLSDEEWMEIGHLHMNSLVTILRNINLTVDNYAGKIAKFSKPRYCTKEYYQQKYKKSATDFYKLAEKNDPSIDPQTCNSIINNDHVSVKTSTGVVSRVAGGFDQQGRPLGLFADGELGWHTNEPGYINFVPGVSLYGQTGMVGSATGFATTVDYYESVSESFRSELNEMIIKHQFTPENFLKGTTNSIVIDMVRDATGPNEGSELPLVIQSPGGHTGLHYSYTTVTGIKGMSDADAKKVFKELDRGIFQEKYIYDHWYQTDNDLLLFDNSITAHRRLGPIIGRSALRTVFDYTNLQNNFYQPYINHGKIARKHIQVMKNCEVKQPTAIDYLKTFFYKY
jgi:alpha-ketoglutarate-dependent taurine dioxygenase